MFDSSAETTELVLHFSAALSLAIDHGQLEEAEAMLACIRSLHPELHDFDRFKAGIAARRAWLRDGLRDLERVQQDAASSSRAACSIHRPPAGSTGRS